MTMHRLSGLKTLEAQAHAAGRAFAYEEADFEPRFAPAPKQGRSIAVAVTAAGIFAAMMHFFGLTGWRAAT